MNLLQHDPEATRGMTDACQAAAAPLSSDDQRLLARVAHVAAGRGCTGAAWVIFQSLRAMRPEHPLPLMGMALCRMVDGRPEEAVRIIRDASPTPADPDGELAVLLGQALLESGNGTQGRRTLEESMRKLPHGSSARQLATLLLQGAEHHQDGLISAHLNSKHLSRS